MSENLKQILESCTQFSLWQLQPGCESTQLVSLLTELNREEGVQVALNRDCWDEVSSGMMAPDLTEIYDDLVKGDPAQILLFSPKELVLDEAILSKLASFSFNTALLKDAEQLGDWEEDFAGCFYTVLASDLSLENFSLCLGSDVWEMIDRALYQQGEGEKLAAVYLLLKPGLTQDLAERVADKEKNHNAHGGISLSNT